MVQTGDPDPEGNIHDFFPAGSDKARVVWWFGGRFVASRGSRRIDRLYMLVLLFSSTFRVVAGVLALGDVVGIDVLSCRRRHCFCSAVGVFCGMIPTVS